MGSSPFSGNEVAASWYANDQIRLRRNLTLTLGLRYDYQGILAGEKLQASEFLGERTGAHRVWCSKGTDEQLCTPRWESHILPVIVVRPRCAPASG